MSEPSDFSISLERTGDAGSSFRTKNMPGQLQRQVMVDRGSKSDFTVQGELVNVIHGLASPDGRPATLIVAEFRFLSADNARRFREATIELLFAESLDPKSKGFDDPEVVRIAPMERNSLNRTTEAWTTTRSSSASATIGAEIANLGGSLSWEIRKSFEKEYRAIVNGAIRIEGRNYGTKNQARWNLLENPNSRDGIPSLLRTVVLLLRKDDEDFFATIKIKAKVDILHSLYSKFQNVLGTTPKDDPVFFDPDLPPVGEIPEGLELDNLSAFDLTKLSVIQTAVPL